MSNRRIVVTDGNGKENTVGYVRGNTGFLLKKKSKHFFRKYQAWAIDEEVLVRNPDIEVFIVKEEEENVNYLTTRDNFIEYSKEINYGGHLPQLALPLKYWTEYPAE